MLRAARAMRSNEAFVLLADDPVARIDVPALAQANGWSVALVEADGHSRFALNKAPS